MRAQCKMGVGAVLVGAVLLACGAQALAWEYIVESRFGGKNYEKYSSERCGDSSVKSVAPGCTPKPTIPGSQYGTQINPTPSTATYRFTPPSSGNYQVFVTWANSTNGDTVVAHTVSHDGGSNTIQLDQNQSSGLANTWVSLGTFAFTAGLNYTVVQTNPTADGGGVPPRLMADAVRWYIACNCGEVPEVSTKIPHMPGDTKVRVTGINANATLVTVYINGATGSPTPWTASPPWTVGPGGVLEADVTVPALVAGQRINATQTMMACDPPELTQGCVPTTGPIVGDRAQIPGVTALPVLAAGGTEVELTGVSSEAKAVSIYANAASPALKVLNNPVPSGSDNRVVVTGVPALSNGQTISATQTLRSVGGSNSDLEGNVPTTGPVVGNRGQVPAVRVVGLVDEGRVKLRVADVVVGTDPPGLNMGASSVKVYANDALIGSSNSPGAITVVDVSALVLGQTIKATQVINGVEANLPTTGRRVMAPMIIEDFFDGVPQAISPYPTGQNRIWYDAGDVGWTTKRAALLLGSEAMGLQDSGWTNGAYAVYDAVIPEPGSPDGNYHLQVDMLVDENNADPDLYQTYEVGVVVNGVHRTTPLLANIPPTVIGKYTGYLTPQQDGVGIESQAVQVLCNTFQANPGDTLLIAFSTTCTGYSRSKTAVGGAPTMWIDNIKLNLGKKPCRRDDVPAVSVTTGPLEDGGNQVTVSGVSTSPAASLVSVYAFTPPDTWELLGSADPLASDTVIVTLDSGKELKKGQTIVATQTVAVCDPPEVKEGVLPWTGPVVGSGLNSGLLLSLGFRETNSTGPVGTNGGNTGAIEWVGPSTTVRTAPQGKPTLPSTKWQHVKFDLTAPDADPVLSYNAGNGVLDGTYGFGVLEHLALAAHPDHPDTGHYVVYIDNVKSGNDLITDFNSLDTGTMAMFVQPSYSGSTSANLLTLPNVVAVDDTKDASGGPGKSLRVEWQFKDEDQGRWLRLTTATAAPTAQPFTNPQMYRAQDLTMDILLYGLACNDPFADVDGDGDVDQEDFASFQICFTGPGGGEPEGCECFDRPRPGFRLGDGDIDGDDYGAFTNCTSGPGIAADPGCDG